MDFNKKQNIKVCKTDMETIQAKIDNNVNIIQNLKKTLRGSKKPITDSESFLLLTLYQENTNLSQKLHDIEKRKR